MRKHIKFLTVILAAVMILQTAPLTALGDATEMDTYIHDEQSENTPSTDETLAPSGSEDPVDVPPVDTEAPAEEPESPSVEPEAPVVEETEPEAPASLAIMDMQWCDAVAASEYLPFGHNTILTANVVTIRVTTTVAASTVTAAVNGKAADVIVEGNYAYVNVELVNGNHLLEVTASDAETTVTEKIAFSVEGSTDYPTYHVNLPEHLVLDRTNEFTVTAENVQNVASVTMNIAFDRSFKVQEVILSEGYTGMYMWYRGNLKLVIKTSDASAIADDLMVTVRIKAPTNSEITDLGITVQPSDVVLSETASVGKSGYFNGTFLGEELDLAVIPAFTVESLDMAIKGLDHTLYVQDVEGLPLGGISIYAILNGESVLVGTTEANGLLVTNFFNENDDYVIFARSETGAVSNYYTVDCVTPVGSEDGKPYGIMTSSPVGGKTFSWMSNYLTSAEAAFIRLSTSVTMKNAIEIEGVSNVTFYNDGKNINRVNEVIVDGLALDTDYYYQIGDGQNWSDVSSFTVKGEGLTSYFAVFGDMAGTANVGLISEAILNSYEAYDFAIQTGNMIGDTSDYAAWDNIIHGLHGRGFDIIHALTPDEKDDSLLATMYGLTNTDYYSYEYGTVFVAAINAYDDEVALLNALSALITDAKNSTCAWKLLVINTPVFSTDPTIANDLVEQYVPFYAEIAGIDVVFSGGTGSYTRTDALREGVASEKNGVTYITAGSFCAQDNEYVVDYEYAYATNEYNAIYLSVQARDDQMTIKVYDVADDGTVTEIDTVVKQPYFCHDEDDHKYRMDYSKDAYICDICDTVVERDTYTGIYHYGDRLFYAENGVMKTGWKYVDGQYYYFDTRLYNAVDGVVTIDGYTYTFENHVLVIGAWFDHNGVTKLRWGGEIVMGKWHTMKTGTYYFFDNGAYASGLTAVPVYTQTGDVINNVYHEFDENGVLIGRAEDGLHVTDEVIVYTLDGIAQHVGLVQDAEGNYYYINSSKKGVRNTTYTITAAWTNGLLPAGTYAFDESGKLIISEE